MPAAVDCPAEVRGAGCALFELAARLAEEEGAEGATGVVVPLLLLVVLLELLPLGTNAGTAWTAGDSIGESWSCSVAV